MINLCEAYGLTGCGEEEQDWNCNDIPLVTPDHEETIGHERVADEGHGDVDDIFRDVCRIVQPGIKIKRAVRFASLDDETLDRSLYVET